MFACVSNQTDCLKTLLAHSLQHADNGKPFCLEEFIQTYVGDKNDQFDCFAHAIKFNNFDLLRALVNDAKINPDGLEESKSGQTVVHLAVEKGQALMLHFLAELGVKLSVPDREGNTPLHLAV